MLLFFLTPDGRLLPSPRTVGGGGFEDGRQVPDSAVEPVPPSAEKTVAALLSGPTPPERRAGMANEPSLPGPGTRVDVTVSGGRVELGLAVPLDGLHERAERQLVCTVAYAVSATGSAAVTLRGTDGTRAPAWCDLLPDPEPAATGTAPR
ncbi:hypothetical protein HW445_16775 [Streptomyces sp. UH6]|nr:hypothetical protein [Streptomyces sp. UH6]